VTASGDAGAPRPHVLIVEDSSLVSDAMRILFEASAHRVTTAASVAEAVKANAEDPADLVLLDLTLPDGDGLAVLGAANGGSANGAPSRTVFVALTGRDDPATRARCLAAGCADVLVKPVPARELVARSRELMARNREVAP
jgi:DNA-binding response OmpR family regulator